ncbi:MAG TPA: TldD/PmbA family protein [Candidatus Deferrimicrobiaceae bacterium]
MADDRFDAVLREVAGRGGGDAELYVARARARRYEAREGRLDGIFLSDTLSLGLRVFRGGRMGFSYGFRGDDSDLARMVEEALFCADASDPDDAYGLPDAGGLRPTLSLYDTSCESVTEEEKGAFACSLESMTLARDPRMKRVRSASVHETVGSVEIRNSRGTFGARRDSRCTAWVDGVAEEAAEGQTGYGFGFARSLRGLAAADIAGEAAERALRMLGAVRPSSGEYRAVLENGAAAELLEVLVPSLLASQVAKGKSMFAGKVGERVAAECITVSDDPLDPLGSGADPFDGEGTPSLCRELVTNGTLRGFLADAFWGRKLGTGTTGACRRPGPSLPPTVGISNLRIAPGNLPLSGLFEAAGDGILLTEFLGIHTADPVSGDFSVGASGIRIAGGRLAGPLHGFAVSGNVLAMLRAVEAVGADFRWFGNVGAPSLLVRGVAVGGD